MAYNIEVLRDQKESLSFKYFDQTKPKLSFQDAHQSRNIYVA